LLPVAGGRVVLGKTKDHPLYGWDNEFGRRESEVWDFSAGRYLVSNREFREFVDDRGYEREEYWTREGWNWVEYTQARHPLFWIDSPGGYMFRTMAQIIEMPWDWPAEVNYLEAKAFCNWMAKKTGKPIRLPSEDQWHRLRDLHDIPDQPYWDKAPGNINLEHWASSCPVDRFRFGEFFDIIGNVWQWTETPITGFDGFRVHPCYDDFSTPTFDTRHNLIKGGSWISTGNEATRDSRYAFRRHFFQHAGFRYIESDVVPVVEANVYESDEAVAQYCDAHYGEEHFGVPNYPRRMAAICLEQMKGKKTGRALDIGCAVGRLSFELARVFERVTGLDFSARFIRIAADLQARGYVRYQLLDEGELVSFHEKSLADFGPEDVKDRCEFYQADACNLADKYTGYDLVVGANLLDRLYSPRKFLGMIHERMNAHGVLVLSSPYTWLTEHTERDEWPGGFRLDGEPFTTLDGMRELLLPHFEMVGEPSDVAFVLRETARKFQHSVAQVTVWQKR
jgi:putative 4-mercaptohistidine N1-methyltranferase